MTIHLCTFSDESMSRAAQLCVDSGYAHGIDSHARHNPGNIMHNDAMRLYWPAMDRMFSHARGCGLWSWKPLIIQADMRLLKDNDICVYSDAGIEFINNVSHIIERMDQDIFLFGNNWEHAHWCKADVPTEILGRQRVSSDGVQNWLWQDHPKHDVGCACRAETIIFGKQVQASVIFFRVSDYTRSFVSEWLKWCLFEGGRLIDDSPSRLPNHPEFREHRHDQAILTTMAYREGTILHYWPAVYNKGGTPEFLYEQLPEYAGDDYPILFSHHRRRNHEWSNAA